MVYSVDRLINETRQIAADYYQATGKPLPVSNELARHDALKLLPLEAQDELPAGVDAVGTNAAWTNKHFQIKARVIFDASKQNPRLGQVNPNGQWDYTLLVLFDADYQAKEIYVVAKAALVQAVDEKPNKRGTLTINKFKKMGRLAWSDETGLNAACLEELE